jgi:hypothetical protein
VIPTLVRFLFDECYSPGLRDELREFFANDFPNFEYRHVLDSYAASTDDRTWLQPLRDEKHWIVITKDAGRDASTERLPRVCQELNITHVGLTPTLIHAGYTAQKLALTSVWGQMPLLLQLPAGTKLRLGCDDFRGVRSYKLRVGQKPFTTLLQESREELPAVEVFKLES